jgi:hypothetical protein
MTAPLARETAYSSSHGTHRGGRLRFSPGLVFDVGIQALPRFVSFLLGVFRQIQDLSLPPYRLVEITRFRVGGGKGSQVGGLLPFA